MSQTYDKNNSEGFYGPDGEFYPAGSQAAQSMREKSTEVYDREELYPKRPEIKYTTTPYPSKETPAASPAEKNDGLPDGYTGPVMYCKHCGKKIPADAVICMHCGCQTGSVKNQSGNATVVINNANNNVNTNHNVAYSANIGGRTKNKWVAFFLCLFGGVLGLHKFYEGKFIMGIIYLFTGGLAGIGWVIDLIVLLCKPNPYTP